MTLDDFIVKEDKLAEITQDVERRAMHLMLASLLKELRGFRNMYFAPLDFNSIDTKDWEGYLFKCSE